MVTKEEVKRPIQKIKTKGENLNEKSDTAASNDVYVNKISDLHFAEKADSYKSQNKAYQDKRMYFRCLQTIC